MKICGFDFEPYLVTSGPVFRSSVIEKKAAPAILSNRLTLMFTAQLSSRKSWRDSNIAYKASVC